MTESDPDPKYTQIKQALNGLQKDVRDLLMGTELQAGAIEKALDVAVDLYGKSSVQVKRGLDMVHELAQELTGVQSLKITPKPPFSLDVDIKCAEVNQISVYVAVAPLIAVDTLQLGKRIHFESLWDQEHKGLRLSILEGFRLQVVGIPLVGNMWIDIKGSAILKHDEHKRLVVVFDTTIPGVDHPVKITVPLTDILKHTRSSTSS